MLILEGDELHIRFSFFCNDHLSLAHCVEKLKLLAPLKEKGCILSFQNKSIEVIFSCSFYNFQEYNWVKVMQYKGGENN